MGSSGSKAKTKVKPKNVVLKALVEATGFSREELKDFFTQYAVLEEGYDRDTFRSEFLKNFGVSDVNTLFTDKLFEIFDHDQDRRIQFSDFMKTFTLLTQGSLEQRVELMFRVYSTHKRDFITRDSFSEVIVSMLDTLGKDPCTILVRDIVDDFFDRVSPAERGRISMKEYSSFAQKDEKLGATLLGVFWSVRQAEINKAASASANEDSSVKD